VPERTGRNGIGVCGAVNWAMKLCDANERGNDFCIFSMGLGPFAGGHGTEREGEDGAGAFVGLFGRLIDRSIDLCGAS